MDAISALFSDWASGLSGGGGGGELSVVAVSRMSISTPEGVCERGGGQWELRRRHGIPGARHGRRLREGLGRDARCVVGAAKLVAARAAASTTNLANAMERPSTRPRVVSEGGESEDPSSCTRFY